MTISENIEYELPEEYEEILIIKWVSYYIKNSVQIILIWNTEYYLKDTNSLNNDDIINYLKKLDNIVNNLKDILTKNQKEVSEIVEKEIYYKKDTDLVNENIKNVIHFIKKININLKWKQDDLLKIVYNTQLMNQNLLFINVILLDFMSKQNNENIIKKINELNELLLLLYKTFNNWSDASIRLNKIMGRPYNIEWNLWDNYVTIFEDRIKVK